MKFVVLLALVGLVSCRSTLIGGNRARDVTIEYTYLNEHGREVKVEVKADKLGLDLSRDDGLLTMRKPSSSLVLHEPEPVSSRLVPVAPQPLRSRFVQVPVPEPELPEPKFVRFAQPEVESRFVRIPAHSERQPQLVKFIEADDIPTSFAQPKVKLVKFEEPEVETKFVQFVTPRKETETRFVKIASPRQEVTSRFVQAEPKSFRRPVAQPQFVELEDPVFAHPTFPQTSQLTRHHAIKKSFKFSDDNSAEK